MSRVAWGKHKTFNERGPSFLKGKFAFIILKQTLTERVIPFDLCWIYSVSTDPMKRWVSGDQSPLPHMEVRTNDTRAAIEASFESSDFMQLQLNLSISVSSLCGLKKLERWERKQNGKQRHWGVSLRIGIHICTQFIMCHVVIHGAFRRPQHRPSKYTHVFIACVKSIWIILNNRVSWASSGGPVFKGNRGRMKNTGKLLACNNHTDNKMSPSLRFNNTLYEI